MQNDPLNYPYTTYLWVLFVAFWGAIVSTLRRRKEGAKRFSIAEFVGDLTIAGFIGVVTFWLCEASHVPQVLTAALVGISGHLGTRAIMIIETAVAKRLGLEKEMKESKEKEA